MIRETSARLVSAALLAAALSCGPQTTIRVTNPADSGTGSLRAAIATANLAAASTAAVRIELPSGTYTLSRCGADDNNDAGDLDILTSAAVTITSAGGVAVIRQSCAGERVIEAHAAGLLTLSGVTITGGSVTSSRIDQYAAGGGVRTVGDLKLEGVTITGNSATGATGAEIMPGWFVWRSGGAAGGGVAVDGSLTAVDSTISLNSVTGGNGRIMPGGDAQGGGAAVTGEVSFTGGRISDNRAVGGNGADGTPGGSAAGGGFMQYDALVKGVTFIGTSFVNNTAVGGTAGPGRRTGDPAFAEAAGGALRTRGPLHAQRLVATGNNAVGGNSLPCAGCSASGAQGGAVAAETATIENSTITANHAIGGESQACTGITLPDPTNPGQVITIETCAPKGRAPARGGAIAVDRQLTLQGGSYTGNSTHEGSTIYAGGRMQVTGAAASANTGAAFEAWDEASFVDVRVSDNTGYAVAAAKLTLSDCTVTGNAAGISGFDVTGTNLTVANNRRYAVNSAYIERGLTLVNSTLIGHDVSVEADVARLDHVTIVGNGAASGAQLLVGNLNVHRSVVVSGAQGICDSELRTTTSSYNWFDDASCELDGIGDRQGSGNFGLDALANNGGKVATILPRSGSVLIDAIPLSACVVATDARGVVRPQGAACDIGAVEVER